MERNRKWLYYSRDNQNYVIPTIVGCFLLFFIKGAGIPAIIGLLILAWFKCKENNAKLDNSLRVQQERERTKKVHYKYLKLKEERMEKEKLERLEFEKKYY